MRFQKLGPLFFLVGALSAVAQPNIIFGDFTPKLPCTAFDPVSGKGVSLLVGGDDQILAPSYFSEVAGEFLDKSKSLSPHDEAAFAEELGATLSATLLKEFFGISQADKIAFLERFRQSKINNRVPTAVELGAEIRELAAFQRLEDAFTNPAYAASDTTYQLSYTIVDPSARTSENRGLQPAIRNAEDLKKFRQFLESLVKANGGHRVVLNEISVIPGKAPVN